MGMHSAEGRPDLRWWPGWRTASRWIGIQLTWAVVVIGGIAVLNLIPGVHIPSWDEMRGY